LAGAGEVEKIEVAHASSGAGKSGKDACTVCGWIHDAGFSQIRIEEEDVILLRGVLSEIVRLVHQAHEKGLSGLSSKDVALISLCDGYRHPCKAFDDLKHREEYKRLFDTSRRGFISLRGASGRNRNKTEPRPE
jgi:hypothetical protein